MADEMGSLWVDIEIENLPRPGEKRLVRSALVDPKVPLSWIPTEVLESLGVERNNLRRFRRADGRIITRWTGGVLFHLADRQTGDEVVFAQPTDSVLVGWRTLTGLNLRVEPTTGQLVDAGPAPAAAAA